MKTMSTRMFLNTISLGCSFSSVIVTIVHKITSESGPGAWLPDDLDKGKVSDFHWLLAVQSLINLGAFLISAKKYVYKEKHRKPNLLYECPFPYMFFAVVSTKEPAHDMDLVNIHYEEFKDYPHGLGHEVAADSRR